MSAEARAALAAPPDLATVEQFLFLEARLLDERRFQAWYDLFTEDGVYWAPTRHEQASPVEAVSLFYDDRVTMAARIKRLSHPQAHIQVPISRTAHLVSNIELDAASTAETIIVHASFFMAEHRQDEPRWYGGRYEYRLRPTADGLRIAHKKVVLVNAGAAFTSMSVYL
jgi:3-phenylpropionate/cinnamic acid dioxygenase small subunit